MGSKTESLSQIVHPVLSIVYLGRITNALSSTLVYGYRMQTLEEIKAIPGPRGIATQKNRHYVVSKSMVHHWTGET